MEILPINFVVLVCLYNHAKHKKHIFIILLLICEILSHKVAKTSLPWLKSQNLWRNNRPCFLVDYSVFELNYEFDWNRIPFCAGNFAIWNQYNSMRSRRRQDGIYMCAVALRLSLLQVSALRVSPPGSRLNCESNLHRCVTWRTL